ncbi:hypothetical protein [Aequorivita xiaoshiensis]|uniref:Phosphoribosylaminoimidazolesuccinocarboxamide synthase n=1 Tax=Aequorivita xiaoshiensis TaxID=2874476 RepID=A0A9X1QYI6_9FLAO|nr:hypothetical protein [Aequorivita xiaoshiensis]MCG2429935.1 hypothetical protein [Aequorivita xiaoshiensis]
MDEISKFKTYEGFCHILEEKIIFTSDGNLENYTSKDTSENKVIYTISIIFTVLCFLYLTYNSFKNSDWINLLLLFGIVVFTIYDSFRKRKYFNTSVIKREKIIRVTFHRSKKCFSRAYFRVDFIDDKNKSKSRKIILPGSLCRGLSDSNKALDIMLEQGMINRI